MRTQDKAKRPRGARRALRWARNIALGLIGFVGVVLLAAYLVFQTGWGREMLRSQIEARMSDAFVGGAKIGGLSGNPLTELVLEDVVINGPDKAPAIAVKRLTVKLPLLPLISNELRVDTLIAEQLDVHIKKDAQGQLNLANLTKPGPKSTWSIKLPNVEVHAGHVRIDGVGSERIDIDNIELYVDAALPFAGPIDATVSLSADWRQQRAPIDLAATVHIDQEVAAVRSLAAQVSDIDLLVTNLTVSKGVFSQSFGGSVAIYAPAKTVRAFAPHVNMPGDIALSVVARPDGRLTHLDIDAALGAGELDVLAIADVQAKLARGVLSASRVDLAALTNGKIDGTGGAFAAFDVDGNDSGELPTVQALVTAWGRAGRAPQTTAVISIASGGERLFASFGASSDSGLSASGELVVHKRGDKITLESSQLVARTPDAKRATLGLAPIRGALSANLHASGAIAPKLDLAVRGHADGKRLRMQDVSADSFRFRIDARNIPSDPIGSGRLEVFDLRRADMKFGNVTLAAGNRPDGKLQVTLRTKPKRADWLLDIDALVTTGDTISVDLQRHIVRAGGGAVWRGDTGMLTIGPRQVELRDLTSKSGRGHVQAEATYVRAGRGTGDLTARLDAALEMSDLKKAYRGHIDAHVDVTRTRGRMTGTVLAKASGLSLDPKSPMTMSADAKIIARADQLSANLSLSSANAGAARIALDVDAPKNVADARAWSLLGREAIRNAELTFDRIDLAKWGKVLGTAPMQGRIDGSLALTPKTAGGAIAVRGVQIKQTKDLGTIEADVRVTQAGADRFKTLITARLQPLPSAVAAKDVTRDGIARFHADATFETPERLFDPGAWRALGAHAFRGGTIRAERLAFQPGTLERLGIVSDLRGELAVGAELEPGMKELRFAVNLHNLRGGLFAKPIAVNVSGVLGDRARVVASVHSESITLLRMTANIPVSLDQLRTDPGAARTAPLTANATIAQVPARTLMTVIGTSQITGGTLDGSVKLGGTVGRPTVVAKLVARDVSVPPESAKPTQSIKVLTLDASWDGEAGKVAVDVDQTAGGKLRVRAQGAPAEPGAVIASLDASRVDLAPLVAFMPGPAGGLGGRMDAKFTLKGADPATADLAGSLHLTNARIPIAPAVGTLFKGDVKLDVRNRIIDLTVKGKLGRGDVTVTARAPLEGATPRSGKLTLTLRKVQLIGTTQPILSGVVTADVARVDEQWRANVRIDRMTVKVPPEKGTKLSPAGAPSDLVYGGEKIHHGKKKGKDAPVGIVKDEKGPADFKPPSQVEGPVAKRRAPEDPIVDVKVVVRNVFVESNEVRGLVGGNLRVRIAENKEVGVLGYLSLSRGVLDLFSRRYQVDKANLNFDGSPDPVLDVRITHDFPEVTTITEVRGRMSKPTLFLTSQPANYTQAELLGFLLGGEPGGDHENAPSASERVAGAGASFLGNKVGGYVKKALPVDIDVLRYEAASSSSSAAVTVGTWITDSLFLAYRRHLEARPDENAGEGELEYWIRRRLVLEAIAGDRGVHGVDLLWRRRW